MFRPKREAKRANREYVNSTRRRLRNGAFLYGQRKIKQRRVNRNVATCAEDRYGKMVTSPCIRMLYTVRYRHTGMRALLHPREPRYYTAHSSVGRILVYEWRPRTQDWGRFTC